MTATYTPRYVTENNDIQRDWAQLQAKLDAGELTHIRTNSGEIWKSRKWLNKKSVPIDDATQAVATRVPFDKVESFGTMINHTPELAHSERAHALLSASSAHRWLHCTPSARLNERYDDTSSDAAEEGTAAHELAEHKLRTMQGAPSARPESPWQNEDMDAHTDDYVDCVMAELVEAKRTSPNAFLAIEQRLDFSHLVPDGFGTGDALIVTDDRMTVVDLKYGKGVEVSATRNPQMMLYALGALNQFGMLYPITTVRMVIFQPRLNNISMDEITVQELLDWAENVVRPAAVEAMEGTGELVAGEWCRFCKHSPQCPAQAAQYFAPVPTAEVTPNTTFTPPQPDTLTDDQVAQIVGLAGEMKKWLTNVEKHALEQANQGRHYPGLKLVEGRSNRTYSDEKKVAEAVQAIGEDPWKPRELIGITDMTKKLGKKKFNEVVAPLLDKPAGKPTLVPESDERPELAVATPETVFQKLEETA